MTKKILYANGDSFVFGMECLEDNPVSEDNKMYAFPKIIGDNLGVSTYINNSYNGATNDFIFKNTIIDLKNLENQGHRPEDIFVVIGITSLYRTEIDADNWVGNPVDLRKILDIMKLDRYAGYPASYDKYNTIFVNPNYFLNLKIKGQIYNIDQDTKEFLARFLWTENVQRRSQEARMIALNDILTLKGYKHIFVNTVHTFSNVETLDLTCKNFYKIDSETFYQFGIKFPEEHRLGNHFSPVPHIKYAEILFDYIQKNIL